MTKSIQQIEQDIRTLEGTVIEVAEEFQGLYGRYIDLFLESVEKQLILATYQLCTQIYPEPFLRLSLNQKQNLQQNIRKLGKEFAVNVRQNLENIEEEAQENINFLEEMLKNLPFLQQKEAEIEEDALNEDLTEEKTSIDEKEALLKEGLLRQSLSEEEAMQAIRVESQTSQQGSDNNESDSAQAALAGSISSTTNRESLEEKSTDSEANQLKQEEEINLPNPEYLIRWQRKVEKIIKKNLDSTSKKANKSLQEVSIIPNRLPTKIIDVAVQAEEAASGGNRFYHLANILNLAIETDKDKKGKPTTMTQISILRLRLSEIEFADPVLSNQRHQIRESLKKIQKLKQQYQAKQREYAIAQAESAWRSSWYED
jgi:hypothetical protein